MLYIKRSRFTRFVVVPVTLLALFSGCYKWTVPERPLDDARVRVTRLDGESLHLYAANVERDTLFGRTRDGTRVAIPTDEIRTLRVRQAKTGETVLLVTALGLLVVSAVAYGIECSGDAWC